jgi:hypothetical protein
MYRNNKRKVSQMSHATTHAPEVNTDSQTTTHESAVLGSMFRFFQGEPQQVVELESEVLCTHYMFEGPMSDEE